tara:strand:- start:383 stop:523 length:141 start_codon:yes stop_codon:yes gene_type:complete
MVTVEKVALKMRVHAGKIMATTTSPVAKAGAGEARVEMVETVARAA